MSTAEALPAVQTNGRSLSAVGASAPQTVLVGDIITNPAMFDHVQRIAKILAHGAFTPKHLKRPNIEDTIATCFRVAAQAIRWGFDPFGVADETYEVHGRLGYQGKLIIAVINARANLRGRLRFDYQGQGAGMTVTVSGQFQDEDEARTVQLSVAQAKTANEMWTKDPEQKLAYSGAIKWARRHCPEVMMGVQIVEDLESIVEADVQPARAGARTLAELTSELSGEQSTDNAEQQSGPNNDVGGEPTRTDDESQDGLLQWQAMVDEAGTEIELGSVEEVVKKSGSLTAEQKSTINDWISKRRKSLAK